jgi:hypothetical protein
MRIFLSCQQALRRHEVPAYAFWEYYFRGSFAEAGHELLEVPGVDWAEGLTALGDRRTAWLDRTWSSTVLYLRQEHARRPVDLFLGYLFPDQVDPQAVRQIRSLGIPCVNFFCDNVREFTSVPDSYRDFDLHWVPESEARPMYSAAGLPLIYAPMPVWTRPEMRTVAAAEKAEVLFVGSHDDLRQALLDEAVGLGLPLSLHGSGWAPGSGTAAPQRLGVAATLANQVAFLRKEGPRGFVMRETYRRRRRPASSWTSFHAKPPLIGDDYFNAIREAEVVLGINRYPSFRHPFSKPGRYSRLRDIEAPMLGGCYLTEWAPGLDDLYDIGSEIETYRSASELVEKSRRLASDPAHRLSLRKAGQKRALAHHSIQRSMERVAEFLGIGK